MVNEAADIVPIMSFSSASAANHVYWPLGSSSLIRSWKNSIGCVSVPGSKSCDIKTLADVVHSGKKKTDPSGGMSAMMTLTFPTAAL